MPKTAVVTDTNSGMTLEEGRKNGIFVLPMPVVIDETEYLEDVDLSHEKFYDALSSGAHVHTSQPAAGDVMGLWDKVLSEYDEIVHIPMSSGLSGAMQNARIYAEDYNGRVQVVDNQRISVTQRQSAYDAKYMSNKGMGAAIIKQRLEESKFDSSIYIRLDPLEYLKKGGRITPAAATFAKILNLKPILQIQGEKLDAFSKCRGLKQGKSIMLKAVADDAKERFGGYNPLEPRIWFYVAHTQNEAAAIEFKKEVIEAFPGASVELAALPLSIACHIGPGSLAIACAKLLPEGQSYKDKAIDN